MSNLVAGCDGGDPAPTTIKISSDQAPALVAFRDGLDGAWQTATKKTATSFEAVVHGPYVISVACDGAAGVSTRQIARTPEDAGDVAVTCAIAAPATHAITGHMAQAGRVQLGDAIASSATADWNVSLAVPNGTYDLMARTDDQLVLRRAIAISGDLALTPAIDLAQEGVALADAAFTATNAAATETLVASVDLDRPTVPYSIYRGPIATAKVAPDSALIATDKQSASLRATSTGGYRELRRPFKVGGTTSFALPAALSGVAWEQKDGALAVSWGTLPELDSFVVTVSGPAAAGGKAKSHDLELSPHFLAATGATRAAIDTDIAGYKPEWKIDYTHAYTRELVVQHAANGETAKSAVTETLP